ncbi:IS3 family transposase [Thermodesulfovibrionales bacterium]|nr:IS3 family transposase [Thermodesulfovibrionales bacterium]
MRKKYNSSFKSKVAIEAIKGDKTIAEISSSFEIHRDQIQKWKKTALDGIPRLFSEEQSSKEKRNSEKLIDELYRQVGQLKVENDWVKKSLILSTDDKKRLIDWEHPGLSISKRCDLLSLSKGCLYYEPVKMDAYNHKLMEMIDRQYLKTPFYGSREMAIYLTNEGYFVNRKRVQRLMRLMNIQAIYPKPNLSKNRREHKI